MTLFDPNPRRGGKINQPGQLAPHPSDKGNQTDVGCKHLSLAEMMFTSLTTKYSKIMVQLELTDDIV